VGESSAGSDDHHDQAALTPLGINGQPNYLFPDIIPFVREDQPYLVNWDISGSNLRVNTIYANVGDGLFEIRSGPVIGPGAIQVLQRVYIDNDAGATFQDFPIHGAVDGHQAHGHIHFQDFSTFELLAVTESNGILGVGAPVAGGVKTSFRLSDGIHLPDPQWADRPSFTSGNTGLFQRVSVGWGDEYSHGTEGQSFSIAGVPVGPRYWLRQTVDPENVVMETDNTNNVFEILIDLNHPGEAIQFAGQFVRPGDPPPPVDGDLTGDELVNIQDWQAFQDEIDSSLAGLSPLERYRKGDLDLDSVHGLPDFVLFRQAYVAAGGLAADLVAITTPEPSSATLATLGLIVYLSVNRRKGVRCNM
jgi:hypothetical protein